jgi:thiol-disulfide isomerase/thioredoxin
MIHKIRSIMPACGIVSILTALGASAAEPPTLAELLKPLSLSSYSSITRPPELSGLSSENKHVSLAGLYGRVIVLNFWATWCQECRLEMPVFERLHRELASQGLSILGINAREKVSAVRQYSKELGLTFPLVLDSSGAINSAYGVIGLPTTFLIARDGRAVAFAIGPREWNGKAARTLIHALLAEPVPHKEKRSLAR